MLRHAIAIVPVNANDSHRTTSIVSPGSGASERSSSPVAEEVRALLERDAERRRAAEIADKRFGGLVVIAVGIGLGTAPYFLVPGRPVYLVALVPGLVGGLLFMGALRAKGGAQ